MAPLTGVREGDTEPDPERRAPAPAEAVQVACQPLGSGLPAASPAARQLGGAGSRTPLAGSGNSGEALPSAAKLCWAFPARVPPLGRAPSPLATAVRPGRTSRYLNVHRVPAQHTSHGVRTATAFPRLPAVPEWSGTERGRRRSRPPGQQRPSGRAPLAPGPGPPRRAETLRVRAALGERGRCQRDGSARGGRQRSPRGEDAARQKFSTGFTAHRPRRETAAQPQGRGTAATLRAGAPGLRLAPGRYRSPLTSAHHSLRHRPPPFLSAEGEAGPGSNLALVVFPLHKNPTQAACARAAAETRPRSGTQPLSCPEAEREDPSRGHTCTLLARAVPEPSYCCL